jgi:hypothetical protein
MDVRSRVRVEREAEGRTARFDERQRHGRQDGVTSRAIGMSSTPETATSSGTRTLDVSAAGTYHVWLLVKFSARNDDACVLALDGTVQPPEEQFSGGDLYTYGTQEIWFWTLLSDLRIPTGPHTLSVLARKSGLRIDRLYLTSGPELPPADAAWQPSRRRAPAHGSTSSWSTTRDSS